MKDVNCTGEYRKEKWYNNHVFPLIPIIIVKKKDKYNTSGFSFKWLFFNLWSLDSFAFELSFVCTSHWGIGIIGILPYLRWVVTIPLPIPYKWNYILDRKTEDSLEIYG